MTQGELPTDLGGQCQNKLAQIDKKEQDTAREESNGNCGVRKDSVEVRRRIKQQLSIPKSYKRAEPD